MSLSVSEASAVGLVAIEWAWGPFICEFWLEQTADDGLRLGNDGIVGFPMTR